MFPDLVPELQKRMPGLKGRLLANQRLADITWFRVGGPAQVLFTPADEADLAYFLSRAPADLPVTVIGLGSNLLVRDGGLPGVVIRLARGFADVKAEPGHRLRAGTAVPDVKLSRAAADAGISGLAFYRGIPGSVGGALRMNGGAHGTETKDTVVEARAKATQANVRFAGNPTDPAAMRDLAQAESGLSGALGKLMMVTENYPQLKADATMRTLMEELASTENRIARG